MAFVVPTKRGTFEVRESRSTPAGPRSRTLATFKELTDETIEKARARSSKPLSADELRAAAVWAGASVVGAPVDRAARRLIAKLAEGEMPEPNLRRLILAALAGGPSRKTSQSRPAHDPDAARSAAAWIDASPRRRGDTLRELLLLADALPVRRRSKEIGYPRLESG